MAPPPFVPQDTPAPTSVLIQRDLNAEVDGEMLDLAPLLAALLKRDSRWLDARQIAAIDNDALILLRAPGGSRIDSPAAPLKAIVGAMVDRLTDPLRAPQAPGPLLLSTWETHRLEALRRGLMDTQASLTGLHGGWQLQGDMGLGKTAQVLAHRLMGKQAEPLDVPALIVLPTTLIVNWQAEASCIAPSLRVLKRKGFAGAQIAILDAPSTMERAKMALLCDMLPELVDEGRRVLVFSQFTAMLGLVEGSIEERMLALQARKTALAEGVLGSDSAIATKFSAEDPQGLLAPMPPMDGL